MPRWPQNYRLHYGLHKNSGDFGIISAEVAAIFGHKKNHRSGKAMVIGVGVTSLYKNGVNYFFIIPGEEEYMKKDC